MTYNTPLIGIRDDLSFYPDMFALAIVDVATIASVHLFIVVSFVLSRLTLSFLMMNSLLCIELAYNRT